MTDMELDNYRGANKWAGLMPSVTETDAQPRVWDEGFRSFLIRYGMFNHVVYDVFVKQDGKDGDKMFGRCRFQDDLEAFTREGLKFSYDDHLGERRLEYDFSEDYRVVGNIVASPQILWMYTQENWFGFVAMSNDDKELVIVYRGTLTNREWMENATITMEHLNGQEKESGCAAIWNTKEMMVHAGFQQLYEEAPSEGESPKETVRRLVEENKGTLDKITVIGHSLGGAMAQLCGFDLVHYGVAGHVPVTVIGWGAPKIANGALSKRADSLHPKLRVLRVRNPADSVSNLPPDWLWSWTSGGFRHMGVALDVHNKHLVAKKIIKNAAGANHNLQMYLYNIDPSRDVALMNKNGDPLSEDFSLENNISPYWHSQTWPRTIYHS